MSGYIYVKNWDKRQHHKYESPPWHKVYNDTLRDDDYLSLTSADRGLLHDLWTLASLSGDGRVSADRTFLARHLNVRRVSLEPLINAGFIEVLDTKRVRTGYESVSQSKSKSREDSLNPSERDLKNQRANGTNPRAAGAKQKRQGAVQRCRYLWHQGLEDGEHPDTLRASLEYEYHHDKTIVTEALGAP